MIKQQIKVQQWSPTPTEEGDVCLPVCLSLFPLTLGNKKNEGIRIGARGMVNREPAGECRKGEQRTENREPRTGNREQRTGNRERGRENRKRGTKNRQQRKGEEKIGNGEERTGNRERGREK